MDTFCRRAIETTLILMAAGAPWALGGTLLWAVRALATGRFPWRADPPLAALAGLTLLAGLQLLPLPSAVLRAVSPGTGPTNEFLRPAVSEQLPDEANPTPRPDSFPVSLSPPDTRAFCADLFALTLLYAAARSNLSGPGPFVRLAWVAAANGALLCLLGIAQRLSHSPPGVVYWTVETPGEVFGPFVNRNHLAFYVLPCLGLAGALLAVRLRDGASELLSDPGALWLLTLAAAMAVRMV